MSFNRKQKGNEGELIAAQYLQKNGWEIIEMNFSIKWGEIDIIACKGSVLAFVEVKYKSTDDFGTPEGMITRNKINQVNRIAQLYLEKNSKLSKKFDTFRIDAIAVTGDSQINYYENVGAEFI